MLMQCFSNRDIQMIVSSKHTEGIEKKKKIPKQSIKQKKKKKIKIKKNF